MTADGLRELHRTHCTSVRSTIRLPRRCLADAKAAILCVVAATVAGARTVQEERERDGSECERWGGGERERRRENVQT